MSQAGAKLQSQIPPEAILEGGGVPELSRMIFRELLIEQLRILGNQRRFLVRAVLAGMVFGRILVFVVPVEYESSAQLMPSDAQSDAGMAMMAALAGEISCALGGRE